MPALGQLLDAYAAGTPGAGDLVFGLLSPLARREAGQAATHLPLYQRDDFVADALLHVFAAPNALGRPRICSFSVEGSSHGRLVCWMRRVIQRLLQSTRRASRRRPAPVALPETLESAEVGPDAVAEGRDPFWAAPLRRADLDSLSAVPATLRVRLVAITGAWGRVPAETWEGWLREYERGTGIALTRPCPPDGLLTSANVHQFFTALAGPLGTSVSALNAVLYNQLPRFRAVFEYLAEGDYPSDAGRGPVRTGVNRR
jgi:hypothetical protein